MHKGIPIICHLSMWHIVRPRYRENTRRIHDVACEIHKMTKKQSSLDRMIVLKIIERQNASPALKQKRYNKDFDGNWNKKASPKLWQECFLERPPQVAFASVRADRRAQKTRSRLLWKAFGQYWSYRCVRICLWAMEMASSIASQCKA